MELLICFASTRCDLKFVFLMTRSKVHKIRVSQKCLRSISSSANFCFLLNKFHTRKRSDEKVFCCLPCQSLSNRRQNANFNPIHTKKVNAQKFLLFRLPFELRLFWLCAQFGLSGRGLLTGGFGKSIVVHFISNNL